MVISVKQNPKNPHHDDDDTVENMHSELALQSKAQHDILFMFTQTSMFYHLRRLKNELIVVFILALSAKDDLLKL